MLSADWTSEIVQSGCDPSTIAYVLASCGLVSKDVSTVQDTNTLWFSGDRSLVSWGFFLFPTGHHGQQDYQANDGDHQESQKVDHLLSRKRFSIA